MGKGRLLLVGLVLVMVGLVFIRPVLIGPAVLIPHGYDGIVSSVHSIDHDYQLYREYDYLYWRGIDPYNVIMGLETPVQSGIRIQISSPQYVESRDLDLRNKSQLVTQDLLRVTTQKLSLFTFEMSATLQTYGEGWLPIENVVFWIELKNNDNSVFTDPDDVAVAIINVVTIEAETAQEAGGIEVDPEGVGFDCPYETIDGHDATVSFDESTKELINLENFKKAQDVRFPLVVQYAEPTPFSPIDWRRVEAQFNWKFQIDVVVVGEWRELRPYHTVVPPPPDKTIWDLLAEALGIPVFLLCVIMLFVFMLLAGGLSFLFVKAGGKYGIVAGAAIFLFFVWLMFESGLLAVLQG